MVELTQSLNDFVKLDRLVLALSPQINSCDGEKHSLFLVHQLKKLLLLSITLSNTPKSNLQTLLGNQ